MMMKRKSTMLVHYSERKIVCVCVCVCVWVSAQSEAKKKMKHCDD